MSSRIPPSRMLPSRALPPRPSLEHLKHEAKALHAAFVGGDPSAIRRVHDAIGEKPSLKLTDAQRAVAREYGFVTWARLRAQVHIARGLDEALDAFLAALHARDAARARDVLRAHPGLASERIHVAAALGLMNETARLLAADASRISARAGDPSVDPLLALCYSPLHGESAEQDAMLLDTARLLLANGADPNAREGRYGVPALYAVTGWQSALPIARLLLDAGANPTDGESLHHAAEHFHEDALDLLLSCGADLDARGTWGNTPLYFLLRWFDAERRETVGRGIGWLLEHGADPNVRCAEDDETSLHAAVRRHQSVRFVRALLDHGADVHVRRADGSTPWRLARLVGSDAVASLLESAGAAQEPLTALETLIAACGRGDVTGARALATPALLATLAAHDFLRLPDAAEHDRPDAVRAFVAAGFPLDAIDGHGATALHYSALHGRARAVRALLAAGAAMEIRDRAHGGTPLGWACFGADVVREPEGDYAACVRALLDAGAHYRPAEHQAQDASARAALNARGDAM